jgi:hypothetical protein
MSAYKLDDERAIRTGRLAHDWMKSGLLTPAQYERIKPELQVDLRRTNLFLRLVLFVFAMLILQSGFGLVAIFVDIRRETPTAILCAVAAVASFWLAGYLVQRYRLYRFGIEEAAAVAAILLMGASAAAGWSGAMGGSFDVAIAAGLVGAAAVAVAVFIRFGYLYAALAAIACITALPFLFGDSEIIHRLAAIAILSVVAAVAWVKRDEYGADHPGDTTEWIEAAAWVGIYCLINLQIFTKIDRGSWFYWATYAGIWIVPPLGLWLSIRGRHRLLLDVSVLILLATLMSNKAYLGSARYPWDPIVFGLLLMGGAIAIKRWLAGGENGARAGFTAARILASDRSKIGVVGTVASLAHPGTPEPQPAAAADPIGGGGRAGGAGSSGSF